MTRYPRYGTHRARMCASNATAPTSVTLATATKDSARNDCSPANSQMRLRFVHQVVEPEPEEGDEQYS